MADSMSFPTTVEEFMEQYKITDTEQVYTNGIEFVPIFRMKQWFEHQHSANVAPVVKCKDCKYYKTVTPVAGICKRHGLKSGVWKVNDFCSYGKRKEE